MLKKLHMSLIFSTLVVSKQLSTIIVDMRNFVTKFGIKASAKPRNRSPRAKV